MRVAALVLVGAAAMGQTAPPATCRPAIDRLLAPVLFGRFPAAVHVGRTVPPDVRRGEAETYRTVLRREGRGPADFAGHYRLVRIGCGAGTVCPAFVDVRTGRVAFAPALRGATALAVDADAPIETLTYRRDSRLLVVIGTPNEDEGHAGASYFDYRDGRLRRIGFVAQRDLCAGRGARL